jgi:hypothetical protein
MASAERLTLAEAIKHGKVDQFVAEHKGETGDGEAFEATFRSMAGKSKEAPEASSPPDHDG